MAHLVTGTFTYSSQANRDAAITRVNSAIASYNYVNKATVFTAGIATPTTTTLTISMESLEPPGVLFGAIMTALVAANRHTAGYLSLNTV